MAERTYLYGYATPFQRLTLAQLNTRLSWVNLAYEFRRRLLGMFDYGLDHGIDVGMGGGWRSSAQQEQVFRARYHVVPCPGQIAWSGQCWTKNPSVAPSAPPGRSYHETTPPNDGGIAADLIGQIAWADTVAHLFGLRSLADLLPPNNELWHHQPSEVATARRNYDGVPLWPFPIPGGQPLPEPPDEEDDMAAIAALYVPDAKVIADRGDKTFALRGDGGIRHASGPDVAFANSVNAPTFPITSVDHYDQLDANSRQGLPV